MKNVIEPSVRRAKRLATGLRTAINRVDIEMEEDSQPGVTTLWARRPSTSIAIDVYDDDQAIKCKGVSLARVTQIDLGMVTVHEGLVPENQVAVHVKRLIEREDKLLRLQRDVQELREKLKAA